MATRLGTPAVNDPREFSLREVQQVIANIRERLKGLDAAVTAVQSLQTGSTQSVNASLTSLQRQITNLAQQVTALEAEVDALQSAGAETDPRVEQMAGEMQQLTHAIEAAESPERLPQVEAQLAELEQRVNEIDPIGQTPAHAALLQSLQSQIDDLNRSVLL
jgi:chromosome segregation ATPase